MQHRIMVHISYKFYSKFYNTYIFVIAITIVLKRCARYLININLYNYLYKDSQQLLKVAKTEQTKKQVCIRKWCNAFVHSNAKQVDIRVNDKRS